MSILHGTPPPGPCPNSHPVHWRGSVLCFNSLLGSAHPMPTQISMWVFGECFFSLGGPAHQSVDFGFKSFLPFGQLFSHLLHWAVPPPSSLALCQTLTLAGKQKAACCPPWMPPSLVPWISQQECFEKAKPSFFHQRRKKYTFVVVPEWKHTRPPAWFGPWAQNGHQVGLQRWNHSVFQFVCVYHWDVGGECRTPMQKWFLTSSHRPHQWELNSHKNE